MMTFSTITSNLLSQLFFPFLLLRARAFKWVIRSLSLSLARSVQQIEDERERKREMFTYRHEMQGGIIIVSRRIRSNAMRE
jgi:hypothetical protein